jgi:acyl-CoA reductase-like NAD-dependent aldehyde dehydrogenase
VPGQPVRNAAVIGRLPKGFTCVRPSCWRGKTDRCWKEEIFGPGRGDHPFDDEAAMLREVNASPYGLSGSILDQRPQRALRVARAVQSGVLSVNSHSSVHVEAPFGGFKQSGLGRDLGMAAMEGYTELKNVYVAE